MRTRTRKGGGVPSDEASTRVDTGQRRTSPAPVGSGNHVSAELYEAARTAYISGGSIKAIRDATGLSTTASQRLLDSGVPQLHLPPIREAARLEAAKVEVELRKREEKAARTEAAELAQVMEARAKAAKRAKETEAKILGDVEKSRGEEIRLVRANRVSATVLAQVNADLLRVSSELARSLLEDVSSLKKLDPHKRMGVLRTVAGIVHRTAQASAAAVQMERLLMGEPTAILGRADGPSTEHMTPDEAEQWLALANRAFARRAARRTVVDVSSAPEPGGEREDVLELTEDLT